MTEKPTPPEDKSAKADIIDVIDEKNDAADVLAPPDDEPTAKEKLADLKAEKAAADKEAAAKAAAQKKAAARAKPRVAKLQVKVAGADKATIRCLAEINANLENLAREGRRLEGIGPELAALLKLLPRVKKELKNAA